MNAEERRQVTDLCRLIQEEQDQAKFHVLLEQLNELLDKDKVGLKSPEPESI